MSLRSPSLAIVLSILALCSVPGCGGKGTSTKGIKATGRATLGGTPLEMGLVVLEPEAGGEAASGQITPDGSFTLYDVKPGRYRAAVQTSMFSGMASQAKKAAAKAGEGRPVAVRGLEGTLRAVPPKFEKPATSGIVVEVKADQPITISIEGE